MSEDFQFDDILAGSFSEVEKPKTPPIGTWELEVISGKLKKGKGENGPAGKAVFACRLIKPMSDVSDAELEVFGDGAIETARVYHDIPLFERRDKWNVTRFLTQVLGADLADLAPEDEVKAAKGHHFSAFLKHRLNEQDPDTPYVDVGDVRAVEF